MSMVELTKEATYYIWLALNTLVSVATHIRS